MSKLRRYALNPALSIVASVALSVSLGCQTAPPPEPAPAPASSGTTSSGNDGGGQVEREEMQVSVEGAEATREGDTLRIDYPVLQDKNDRIPDWVINPATGGVIGGIGVAPQKGMGTKEQIDEARLNARIELVTMLEGRAQRVGRTELEEDYRATEADRTEQSRKNILGVDRNILDGVLAGSRQRALWFDPENGECYVWMVLDGAVLENADQHVTDSVSVFKANKAVASEYRPVRRKPEVPRVVVQVPEAPPPPEAPKSAIEQLEGKLKEIETIPSTDAESEGN